MFGSATPLQTRGEVRRLAHNRLLLGCAGANEITDHNKPGCNAHASL
jgi:hypothetical protein